MIVQEQQEQRQIHLSRPVESPFGKCVLLLEARNVQGDEETQEEDVRTFQTSKA